MSEIQNEDAVNETEETAEDATGAHDSGEEAQEETVEQIRERLSRAEDNLKKVRDEAAARRVENRELTEKLASAKSDDEVKGIVEEYQNKVKDLDRQILVRDVAEAAGLPAALRDRLRGETEEELKADAEALLKAFPQPKPTGRDREARGGLDPTIDSDDEKVIDQMVNRARRRHIG